jgi:ABC-type Fe3+-hydroxamate transport system substrate-binding protein
MTDAPLTPDDEYDETLAAEQVYYVEVTDVTKTAPQRVVSLVPAVTETLFDLGFEKQLVGITDNCLHPFGKLSGKKRLGAVDHIRVEDVIALRPDLVIGNREENTLQDLDELEAAGLLVWRSFPRTVLEAVNLIWDTLHAFMEDDRMQYEKVNLINRTFDWVSEASLAKEHVICKVFVPILKTPLTTFSADTYTHDLIRVCGGTNVFGDRRGEPTSDDPAQDLGRYVIVTLDEVIAAQPDIVILPAAPYDFTEADVDAYLQLDIPAAKTGNVFLIEGTLLTYHGTRLARALNEISSLMCEEAPQ